MKLKIMVLHVLAGFLVCASIASADGVMRPSNAQYPGDFLRLRSTRVDVAITGDVALTTVEQEFANEFFDSTNAVYSFPLPGDARVTDFLFWSNDTLYRAVLKEREQAQNPGTGEGGIDALLTKYLGPNALRVLIRQIPGNGTQRIIMKYISLCTYHQGKFEYRYPLSTGEFVTYPVETVSFSVHVESPSAIVSSSFPGSADAVIRSIDGRHIEASIDRSKQYLMDDINFSYTISTDTLGMDFYSVANDTMDGHFALFLRPRSAGDTANVLGKSVIFLLDRSSSTSGPAFDQSKEAIKECLGRLHPNDRFNVIAFNYSPTRWMADPVHPTPDNLSAAAAFLDGLSASGGSSLSAGLSDALSSFEADSLVHSILLFADGRSPVDPRGIRAANTSKVGIFPIGIGENVSRPRLEMLAYQNYGFPTIISADDPVFDEVVRVFDQINCPVLKDTRMEMGANAYGLLPSVPGTVYNGSRFMVVGRYRNPIQGSLSLGGTSSTGESFYDFRLQFASGKINNKFAEPLWGKEKIDELEREITIYGESDSLKRELIRTSLAYNIRCMYTAYIADKTIVVMGIQEDEPVFISASAVAAGGEVAVEWTLSNSSVSAVNIYRAPAFEGPFVKIGAAGGRQGRFVDPGMSGGMCFYKIECVCTDGRSVWSGVLVPGTGRMPVLYQNYPNPCNPSTRIQYSIGNDAGPAGQRVTLVVFDVLGRQVRTLVASELQGAGAYSVTWDGCSDAGKPMSSGVYFYRLSVGSFAAAKSTLLIR